MKFIRVTRALLAIAILLPASSAFAQQTSSNNHGTAISASYSSLRESFGTSTTICTSSSI